MDAKKDQDSLAELKNTTEELRKYFDGEAKKLKGNPKEMPEGYTPEMRAMFLEFSDHIKACSTEIENLEAEILSEAKQSDLDLSSEEIARIVESQKRAKLKDIARTVFTLACASGMDIKQCLAFVKRFGITDLSSFDSKIGLSPLAAAMLRREDSLKAMKELQAAGANIHTISPDGNNIAHLAVLFGADKKILDYLIKQEVNFNLVNKQGMTPLDMAVGRRNADFIKYLMDKASAKFQFTPVKVQNAALGVEEEVAKGRSLAQTRKRKAPAEEKEEEAAKEKIAKVSEVEKSERRALEEKTLQQDLDGERDLLAAEQKKKGRQVVAPMQQQSEILAQYNDFQHRPNHAEPAAKSAKEQEELRRREQEQNNRDRMRSRESIGHVETDFLGDFVRGVKMLGTALSHVMQDVKYSVNGQVVAEAQVVTQEQSVVGQLVQNLREGNLMQAQNQEKAAQNQNNNSQHQSETKSTTHSWREAAARTQQNRPVAANNSWTKIIDEAKKSSQSFTNIAAKPSSNFVQAIIKSGNKPKEESFSASVTKSSSSSIASLAKSGGGVKVGGSSGGSFKGK